MTKNNYSCRYGGVICPPDKFSCEVLGAKWQIRLFMSDAKEMAMDVQIPIIERVRNFIGILKLPKTPHKELEHVFFSVSKNVISGMVKDDIETIGRKTLRRDGGVFVYHFYDSMCKVFQYWHYVVVKILLREGIDVTIVTKNTKWIYEKHWQELLNERVNHTSGNVIASLKVILLVEGKDVRRERFFKPWAEERVRALDLLGGHYGLLTEVFMSHVEDLRRTCDFLVRFATGRFFPVIRIGMPNAFSRIAEHYDHADFFAMIDKAYHLNRSGIRIKIDDSVLSCARRFLDDSLIGRLANLRPDFCKWMNEHPID